MREGKSIVDNNIQFRLTLNLHRFHLPNDISVFQLSLRKVIVWPEELIEYKGDLKTRD